MRKKTIPWLFQRFLLIGVLSSIWLSITSVITSAYEEQIGDYRIRHIKSHEELYDRYERLSESWIEIYHQDTRVYQREVGDSFIQITGGTAHDSHGERYELPVGEDLTGNGIPNVVIKEMYRKGMTFRQACRMDIFEIGECFRPIAAFSDCGSFEDFDGDGQFEATIVDWTFEYWEEWHSEPPAAPLVILRYDATCDRYTLAEDLMYRPAPSAQEFDAMITAIHNDPDNQHRHNAPSMILWEKMIELLYSGHEVIAWRLYESAWQPHFGDKVAWAEKFKARLSESLYWKHVFPRQVHRDFPGEYPALLQRTSYPPEERQMLRVETAYEVQCGTILSCDLTQCTASTYGHGANSLMISPTEKGYTIHVIVTLIDNGQANLLNLFLRDDDVYDFLCDEGSPVFLIHKSAVEQTGNNHTLR